jgi:hypothetical protein
LPPGDYASVSYCYDDDGNTLVYEPQLLTITGDAPIDDIDLTASEAGDRVTFAGGSCTSGPVEGFMEALPLDDLDEWLLRPAAHRASHPGLARSGIVAMREAGARQRPVGSWQATRQAVRPQGLADDEFLEVTVEPDESGAWSVSDDTGFEQGAVFAYATCGDPFEEGWFYDPQGVAVMGDPTEPPPPTPPPPTPPPETAPTAVPAAPTYAG